MALVAENVKVAAIVIISASFATICIFVKNSLEICNICRGALLLQKNTEIRKNYSNIAE